MDSEIKFSGYEKVLGYEKVFLSATEIRLLKAAPDLLEACQTFAEWLQREEDGMPKSIVRDTPEGEIAWREWYVGNLDLCRLAQDQARAAIAKAVGKEQP